MELVYILDGALPAGLITLSGFLGVPSFPFLILKMVSASFPYLALLSTGAIAATVTKQLTIANAELSPDGFKRT